LEGEAFAMKTIKGCLFHLSVVLVILIGAMPSCEPTVLDPVGSLEQGSEEPEVKTVVCGDSIVNQDLVGFETCDDGNTVSGDGCSGHDCQVECGFVCPSGGGSCEFDCELLLSEIEAGDCEAPPDGTFCCGDGKLQEDLGEVCDDGNRENDDLCPSDCGLIL
jgi:cysteine-rich repeat protein